MEELKEALSHEAEESRNAKEEESDVDEAARSLRAWVKGEEEEEEEAQQKKIVLWWTFPILIFHLSGKQFL